MLLASDVLAACGLGLKGHGPNVWAGQRQWHLLQVLPDRGQTFLRAWQLWREDPQRPERLFVTVLAENLHDITPIATEAQLSPQQAELTAACVGLLPGTHRLVFEGGRLHLTWVLGPVDAALRELDVPADTVISPPLVDGHRLKAVARICRSGTRLHTPQGLSPDACLQHGFAPLQPPLSDKPWVAVFAPPWTPRSRLRQVQAPTERRVVVIGAGLSGAAVAHSLALRGWQVTVLDAGDGVGAGASGLPAGLAAPHTSPDDNVLSRITRAGVRASLQRARHLLHENTDWALSGVLEHRVEGKRRLPNATAWPASGHDWSAPADDEHLAQAGLPAGTAGVWHALAGWIRPRQLVQAQLQSPGIRVLWQTEVAHLQRSENADPQRPGDWHLMNAHGEWLASAPCVILASAYNSLSLMQGLCETDEKSPVPLHPLRGQISFGRIRDLPTEVQSLCPPFPVNGHGSFISGVPMPHGEAGWFLGSTFERDCREAPVRAQDHLANQQRLNTLLPTLGAAMQTQFAPESIQGWAGLRCTLPDRLPAVGPVHAQRWPGLWTVAGMGARGISLAVLCGELSAAWLENEPLPLAPSLARHLMAERFAQPGLSKGKSPSAVVFNAGHPHD